MSTFWRIIRTVWGTARLIKLLMRNPQTPLLSKILFAIGVLYLISPYDLVPIFVPILGVMDDIAILTVLLVIAGFLIPADVMNESRREAKKQLPGPK